WPSQTRSSQLRNVIRRTCRPLKAAEYSRFCTRGTSTDLSHLLHSARAPLTGSDGCYLSQDASRRGRLRWLAHLSSGFVVAEAASRGVRYDKYFAIGNSSPATYSTGGRSLPCAPRVISHRCNFFLAFLPQWCFIISHQASGAAHASPDL